MIDSFFKNENIYFLYSEVDALNDEYVYGLEVITFEEALFRHLKKLGYKRIVFYNGVSGLYAYEEGMLRKNKAKKRISGILSREKNNEVKLQRNMVESEMLNFLVNFMKREKKGAFIITDFFSLLNNLNELELKELNQLILDFKRLDIKNRNLLFFLEPSNYPLSKIREKIVNYRLLENFIHDILETSSNLIEISKAYNDEVNNLLNYLRIRNSLEADFLGVENLSKDIVRYLRQNKDLTLKYVHKKILNVDKIDFDTINNKLNIKAKITGWDKFNELVGVDEVKSQIEMLVNWVKKQKKEESKFNGDIKRFTDIKEQHFKAHLNFVLKGNPGTGKTTIAKIIGEIFKEEGILPYGHFIKASVDDFVAGYVGQTPIKTAELLKRAKGGVIFLDEAYGLIPDNQNNSDFKNEAITTIIDKLSEYEGEICLILAGYEDDIKKLFNTNEGWDRRFPNEIVLRDYNADELKEIFLRLVKKENVKLNKELEDILDSFFERVYKSGYSSKYNAGFSVEFFNSLMQRKKGEVLTIEAIADDYRKFLPVKYQNINLKPKALDELNSLIGLKNVKQEIEKIIATIKVSNLRGEFVTLSHYDFVGNPGTGKTTVANIFTKVLNEIGILKGKVIIASEKELVSGVVGETPKLVKEKVKEAKDGVLFIDEAYSLMNSPAGKTAIDTLIQEMENKKGEFVLILAGYINEIDELLKSNPGFYSRIPEKNILLFEDYNEEELFEIFINFVESNNYKITQEAQNLIKYFIKDKLENKQKHFGNAREMRNLFEAVKSNMDFRISKSLDNLENLDEDFIRTIIEDDIRSL